MNRRSRDPPGHPSGTVVAPQVADTSSSATTARLRAFLGQSSRAVYFHTCPTRCQSSLTSSWYTKGAPLAISTTTVTRIWPIPNGLKAVFKFTEVGGQDEISDLFPVTSAGDIDNGCGHRAGTCNRFAGEQLHGTSDGHTTERSGGGAVAAAADPDSGSGAADLEFVEAAVERPVHLIMNKVRSAKVLDRDLKIVVVGGHMAAGPFGDDLQRAAGVRLCKRSAVTGQGNGALPRDRGDAVTAVDVRAEDEPAAAAGHRNHCPSHRQRRLDDPPQFVVQSKGATVGPQCPRDERVDLLHQRNVEIGRVEIETHW